MKLGEFADRVNESLRQCDEGLKAINRLYDAGDYADKGYDRFRYDRSATLNVYGDEVRRAVWELLEAHGITRSYVNGEFARW